MDLFEYNQRTYIELLHKLENNKRVAVVQCTGSGKGAIATKLITDGLRNHKILLLAPRESILLNYLRSFEVKSNNRIQVATYQGMCSRPEDELIRLGQFADVLILDEYHRCGAEKWGKAVHTLIDNIEKHNGRIIGFTATPIRYLDDERNMTKELFNNVCVEGVDLTSAIKKGILPVFTYVKARYGYTEDVNEYKRYCRENKAKGKIDNNKLALVSDNDKYIHDIIVKETSSLKGCQKWIVFCSNIKEVKELLNHIPKWFDVSVNILEAHSGLNKAKNEENDLNFRNARKGVNLLLTVDKYNEGVHLKDISGVIMLRQTLSPIIFLQQLGRALSAGNKGQRPIIFDFVSNIESIQNYEDLIMFDLQIMADEINEYAKRKAKKDASKGGKIILKTYCEEVDKILAEISKVVGVRWSKEEDDIIRQYFPEEKKDVYKRLQGRTQEATYQRARFLGLVDSREWSRKEDNIIKKFYPIEGVGVVARLDNRTESAVKSRASILKVKKDRKNCWTEDDDAFLKRKYAKDREDKYPIEDAMRLLHYRFNADMIYARLKYLGLTPSRKEEWTSMEDTFLKLCWGQLTKAEIEAKLPRHTTKGIYSRALRLGLIEKSNKSGKSNWTPFEEDYLIECYNEYGPAVYEMFPDRSRRSLDSKIYDLRVQGRIKEYNKKDWD